MAQISRVVTLMAVITLAIVAMFVGNSLANADAAGCYGASCNGLDPMGRCDSDAITVGAMHVSGGMLELRYSPSCAANWGRHTAYRREVGGLKDHIRITAWNPGKNSYETAHRSEWSLESILFPQSSWSQMTDGTKKACTGIEIVSVSSQGLALEKKPTAWKAEDYSTKWDSAQKSSSEWIWGPCY